MAHKKSDKEKTPTLKEILVASKDIEPPSGRHREEVHITTGSRSQFLAIVSHDLRNPLNAIVLNAALINQEIPVGDSGERIRKRVANIQRLADSMNRLITVILDVESIDAGRLPISKGDFALVDVLAETVESFLIIANSHKIKIDADLPDPSIMASFDYDRILQVLSNLMGNAVKFTPPEGMINVSANVREEQKDILFTVSNTGPTIPPEMREIIFDKFSQIQKGDRTGLGLGLYICKWIVEAHDGKIWVADHDKNETTFCFNIPR